MVILATIITLWQEIAKASMGVRNAASARGPSIACVRIQDIFSAVGCASMNIGVCKLTLRLPENQDIKGKRRAIKSLCARVRNKFNVAVSEVGDTDAWQLATLGIVCVSNSSRHTDEVLGNVVAYIEDSRQDLEVVSCDQEVISGF